MKAPWTPEQVKQLQAFQDSGQFHPFTCGNDSRHDNLVPTESGWVCNQCDYTQDWCHDFMVQPLPPDCRSAPAQSSTGEMPQ